MNTCGEDKAGEVEVLRERQSGTLRVVLAINVVLFLVGAVGVFSLIGNLACAWLLLRHRHEDLNMHSVWLCSRNDVINNIAVIAAGVLVGMLHSQWPDLIVGALIAGLFLYTCYGVISRAGVEGGREKRCRPLFPLGVPRYRLI